MVLTNSMYTQVVAPLALHMWQTFRDILFVQKLNYLCKIITSGRPIKLRRQEAFLEPPCFHDSYASSNLRQGR